MDGGFHFPKLIVNQKAHPNGNPNQNASKMTEPALLSEILARCSRRARAHSIRYRPAIPGHEALIATLAFDGKTTAGEAAIAVLAADRSKREAVGRLWPLTLWPGPSPDACRDRSCCC